MILKSLCSGNLQSYHRHVDTWYEAHSNQQFDVDSQNQIVTTSNDRGGIEMNNEQ